MVRVCTCLYNENRVRIVAHTSIRIVAHTSIHIVAHTSIGIVAHMSICIVTHDLYAREILNCDICLNWNIHISKMRTVINLREETSLSLTTDSRTRSVKTG